ncbi:MAG: PAS domain-containing protein [Deltaproteobacteria bacterium]|nr:PAS domain-containing protein [Deltaproteobacteria bacterium]
MKTSPGISMNLKILAAAAFIFTVIVIDRFFFIHKVRDIQLHDEMNMALSDIRVSITKLEFMLDIFVVAGRFETTTVGIIRDDVSSLDRRINELAANPKYTGFLMDHPPIAEDLASAANDWQIVKGQIGGIKEGMKEDDAMLIHNASDTKTIIVNDTIERLSKAVATERKAVFEETKSLAWETLISLLALVLAVAAVFYRKGGSIIKEAALTARRVASGSLQTRFEERYGAGLARLAAELNSMLDSISASIAVKDDANKRLESELDKMSSQISSLKELSILLSGSPSQSEVLSYALKNTASAGMADAAAVYMLEDVTMRLAASEGLGGEGEQDISAIPLSELGGIDKKETAVVFGRAADYPCRKFAESVSGRGYASLITLPIRFGGNTYGFLYAFFKSEGRCDGATVAFFEAAASDIALSTGYGREFMKEYNQRRFLEKVMNQLPYGIAVFDKDGGCILANNSLKRLLGAGVDFSFVGNYKIFEDNVLTGQGMIQALKKAYEGKTEEITVVYSPASVIKYRFNGVQHRLKFRSIPLYDMDGAITSVVLICDDMAGGVAQPAGKERKG